MIPYGTGRSVIMVGLTTLLIYILFFLCIYAFFPDLSQILPAVYWLLPGAIATACVSIIVWWRLLIKPNRFTLSRSIIAGVVSSTLAHPVIWMTLGSVSFASKGTLPSSGFDISSIPYLIFTTLSGIISLSLLSLLICGVPTTIIGAVGGALVLLIQRKLGLVPASSSSFGIQRQATSQQKERQMHEAAQQIMH